MTGSPSKIQQHANANANDTLSTAYHCHLAGHVLRCIQRYGNMATPTL
jgi:hypothetical protein